ncbi:MAG: pspB [Alphaproteobacteria bacterium]|nr:pspB [Alphaproteobacteria bacterium]MDB5721505.1 pspB [Alphaproteobacteria bacterium]
MDGNMIPIIIVPILVIGLPWLIFHYVTKWKSQAVLTGEDERMLDELHDIARRLDDRLCTVERIMTAENPNWRLSACDPGPIGLETRAAVEPRSGPEPRTVSNRPLRSLEQ